MIEWVVYYDDGSSFTSEDGPPEYAPRYGVQAVACRHEGVGRLIWDSRDYYCWDGGTWVPRDREAGLVDYLSLPGREKVVLFGRAIPYGRYLEVYNRAVDDRRLPFKTGRDPREREPPT